MQQRLEPAPGGSAAGAPQIWPWVAVGAATLLWTGNFTVGRAVAGQIDPLALTFLRWALAVLVFAPIAAAAVVRDWSALMRAKWWLFGLGLTGVAAFQTFVYYGVAVTPVFKAVLFINITPAVILAINAVVMRRMPSAAQFLGMSCALAGAIVLIFRGDIDRLMSFGLTVGDLWLVAAAATWAAYTMLLRAHPRDVAPEAALMGSMVVGLALLTPIAAPAMLAAPPPLDQPEIWGAVAYVALFASLAAFALWTYGVRQLGPVRAGQTLNLMPVWAAVLGATLLGDAFETYHATGAALVLLGVLLTGGARRGREPAKASAPS